MFIGCLAFKHLFSSYKISWDFDQTCLMATWKCGFVIINPFFLVWVMIRVIGHNGSLICIWALPFLLRSWDIYLILTHQTNLFTMIYIVTSNTFWLKGGFRIVSSYPPFSFWLSLNLTQFISVSLSQCYKTTARLLYIVQVHIFKRTNSTN